VAQIITKFVYSVVEVSTFAVRLSYHF